MDHLVSVYWFRLLTSASTLMMHDATMPRNALAEMSSLHWLNAVHDKTNLFSRLHLFLCLGACGSHCHLCLAASGGPLRQQEASQRTLELHQWLGHNTLARAVGVAIATAVSSQTASMRRIMTSPQVMSLAVSSSWRQPPSPRDEQITLLPRDEQITSLPLRILAMRQAGTFPQCQGLFTKVHDEFAASGVRRGSH